ncbi:MAG TPA: hypothetical protein VKR83_17525 [Ktedonobacteraceae bacterium]|nr:hypothetical protein [Ktedonobacteraceae bacterium]
MSGLVEIQALVNEAQEKIKESDRQYVRTVLWPDIKSALGVCTDIAWPDRKKLGLLIHKRLEEQRSERVEPERIILEKLIKQIQEGEVEMPEEGPSPLKWLPY